MTPRAATSATLAGAVGAKTEDTHEPVWEVLAAGAAADTELGRAPRDLGKAARIRNWFRSRKIDGFPGDHLNNAIFATFACSWFGRARQSAYSLHEVFDLDRNLHDALDDLGVRNTHDLRVAVANPGGLRRVADHVGVDPMQVLRWEQQADLLRVSGVIGEDDLSRLRDGESRHGRIPVREGVVEAHTLCLTKSIICADFCPAQPRA